jgi:class 3 adenylate cyclase
VTRVNTAARLESASKDLPAIVVVSCATIDAAGLNIDVP